MVDGVGGWIVEKPKSVDHIDLHATSQHAGRFASGAGIL